MSDKPNFTGNAEQKALASTPGVWVIPVDSHRRATCVSLLPALLGT